MNQTNIFIPPVDRDLERRRVLAKVYALLIRLAEEAEKKTASPETVGTSEEKNVEQASTGNVLADQ